MVEIRMQVNKKLAQRLQPLHDWLPTILELSLIGFKTPAVQTASEIIEFLSTSPTPADVLTYHVTERAQERLQRLLAMNSAGAASRGEQTELDEISQIEHILILLKAQAQKAAAKTN